MKIDSTSPIVKKVKPAPIKPTSTISIKFSEKVKGVSEKSVVLVKVLPTGKFKKLKAKVSIDKKKTTAKVNPKGRLRPGTPTRCSSTRRRSGTRWATRSRPAPWHPRSGCSPGQADEIGRAPQAGRDHRVPRTFGTAP